MITQSRASLSLAIFALILTTAPRIGLAQSKDLESHPAYQVVRSYLTYAMGQDWPKSAALIDEVSLQGFRDRYLGTISKARTFQEELDMVRALDCNNLEEVKALDPNDFYIRYHKGVQERYKVTKEKLDLIIKSKKVKLLSLVEEDHDGKKLCHILVRTKHDNGDKTIYSLELISLVKLAGKWMVTLEAMKPTIAEREAAAASSAKK